MQRTVTRIPPAVVVVAAVAATAAALVAGPPPVRAQEEPARPVADEPASRGAAETARVRERVDRLFPELLSDDPSARRRAEREIVKMGEPARLELERIARETDPRRSKAALELLASDRWEEDAPAEDGETATDDDGIPRIDLRRLDERFRREMDEIRKRMLEWEREFRVPDLDDLEWRRWVPEVDIGREGFRGSASGTVVENGRVFAWTLRDDGHVKITTRDGPDAPETTVEAPSLEDLRKSHPDLADRLEGHLPQGGRRFVFVWPPRSRPQEGGEESAPPSRDGGTKDAPSFEPVVPGPVLGVRCAAVPELLREHLDLPEGGIVVESVLPGTLAARLGLERNDVVLRIGGREVAGPADVARVLEAAPSDGEIAVEIVRKGSRRTLSAKR